MTMVYTDEWAAYDRLPGLGRGTRRSATRIGSGQRDDDGDGVREVHCTTLEGLWTGLRNFLRPFRGVNKEYLGQYVAIFQWAHDLKRAAASFLRVLLSVRLHTVLQT